MKITISTIILGLIIGCFVGMAAIKEQPMQVQKEAALVNEYVASAIKEEDVIEAANDPTDVILESDAEQQTKADKYMSMWEASMELLGMGIDVPAEIYEYCYDAGQQFSISPELLVAICYVESEFNPKAKNGSCLGLMQVSEKWHRNRMKKYGVESLYEERGNVIIATDYLRELFDTYGEDNLNYILDTYNGNSHAEEYRQNGTVSAYAGKVTKIMKLMEKANGKENT